MAIVPFESHRVETSIRTAVFASPDVALAQINELSKPEPENNTALYSAVVLGLKVIAEQAASAQNSSGTGSPDALLVVMTDGKNEVLKGDDFGLLDGAAGLKEASRAVHASDAQVIAVGFGDPRSIDESALGQISTKAYMADDLEKLTQAFKFTRALFTNRIVATFTSHFEDRASLAGRTVQVRAALTLPGGNNSRVKSAPVLRPNRHARIRWKMRYARIEGSFV